MDAEQWSEGRHTAGFESAWSASNGLPAVAFASWSGAALAALAYAEVAGEVVLCPSNTFMATPLSAVSSGARVEFVDANRDDLCMSFTDFVAKAERHRPKAAFVVHIGGHIAFEIEQIADYCRQEGIFLIEDCAHAHGASWHGRRAGTWGDAGVWSFAATKTISTGEGGMLVSRHDDLVEYGRAFRNYGKPSYEVAGLNYRMNEFTAAIGIVQTERLDEIVAWKNAAARAQLDPAPSRTARAARRDGVQPLQVHRVRSDRSIHREGLRRAVPPPDGSRGRPAGGRLDRDEPLVRTALLPSRGGALMKVLVTGGSGFIGSHVVDRLLAHGHEPRIFDLVESPYHRPDEVELVIGDLVDQDCLRLALRDCDAVVHLAAVSDVNKVLADPGHAESVNGGGTRTVLEAARLEGVSRIVYASTVWIYGDSNGHGPLDEDEPLSLPGHLYTATKLAGEMYCSSYGALYGMDTTIARFGIPYGPRARPATVLAAFVARALADEPITIAGDGTQSRRFIYVEDLAEGVVATLDPAAIGRRLQPGRRREHDGPRDRRDRDPGRVPGADRPRGGPPRRHPGGRDLGRPRQARAGLGGDDDASTRASRATSPGSPTATATATATPMGTATATAQPERSAGVRRTSGAPTARAESSTAGRAATVRLQESRAL